MQGRHPMGAKPMPLSAISECPSYQFCNRYSFGVMPTRCLNKLVKCAGNLKPSSVAT